MVIAFAGRRVDDARATEIRFPAERVPAVAEEITTVLRTLGATVLVSAAACGADILALEATEDLGIRSCVILPFEPAEFRETSVADRPGDWGERYDRILAKAALRGDLKVLGYHAGDSQAYIATNEAIIAEAQRIARVEHLPVEAIIVWDGKARNPKDMTAAFRDDALRAKLRITEIQTLS